MFIILIWILVFFLQIDLLLPNRHIPYDEILCADSSSTILRAPYLPKLRYWSHVVPEFGTINFYYTPLYFYILAIFMRLFGIKPLSAGLLHVLLRLMSTGVVFAAGYQMGIPGWINGLLALVWAILCVGPTGRPDDLALLFITISYYLVVAHEASLLVLALSGVLVGLSFLTYPGTVILLPVIGVLALIRYSWAMALETVIIMGGLGGLISLLWLIWIIPFWHEFKTIFLDFALPDAKAVSRRRSLADTLKWLVRGVYGSPIPFHYSVLPVSLLMLVVLVQEMENGILHPLIVLLTVLGLGMYLSGLRIHRNYNLLPIIAAIIWSSQVMLANDASEWTSDSPVYLIIGVLAGYQILASISMSVLKLAGTYSWHRKYGLDLHHALIEQIPPGEKVLTNVGHVFYALRARNPVFAPAGLYGTTPGQVAFATQYNDAFRWLVLTEPLTRDDINPGGKFSWNDATFDFFRGHFKLVHTSSMSDRGKSLGLARFGGFVRTLYLYRMV